MTDTIDTNDPTGTTGHVPGAAAPPGAPHRSLPLDKAVFGVAAVAVLTFVVWGAVTPDGMGTVTTNALAWLEKSFGWLFVLTTAGAARRGARGARGQAP